MRLTKEYFHSAPVTELAIDLIGKELHSRINGNYTSGIIVETEAYSGAIDKASHAYRNKRTPRTEIMFGEPGKAYVYLCYGLHHLFNIVVSPSNVADAILVRAIEPVSGISIMSERRDQPISKNLTSGPAKLSQALGISLAHNNVPLYLKTGGVWLEEGENIDMSRIEKAKRIGVDYAEEDAELLWRFYLKDNKWVSKFN